MRIEALVDGRVDDSLHVGGGGIGISHPGFHGDIRAWKQAELLVQAGGCHGHAHS